MTPFVDYVNRHDAGVCKKHVNGWVCACGVYVCACEGGRVYMTTFLWGLSLGYTYLSLPGLGLVPNND